MNASLEPESPRSETPSIDQGPPRVLVVDDNRIVRGLARRILEREGFAIVEADAARKALSLLESEAFDLVLSDIMMPEIDGIAFCRRLRSGEVAADTPLIFFTGLSDMETLSKAFEAGASDYVVKPLRRAELLSRARHHVAECRRKRADRRRIETLDRENQSKTRFLGAASHDLRNPLVSIRGISQYLGSGRFGELSESQREMVETIASASESMLSLVEDLLDASLFESGQIKIRREEEDLAELAETAVRLHGERAAKKGIALAAARRSDDTRASVDRKLVSRVLDNLVSNALKFSQPDTNVVVAVESDADTVTLAVEDEGPGIPETEIPNLFKEFSRLSNQPTGGESSSGIGLYLCKRIVAQHGGRVGAENRPQGGARFTAAFNRS